MRILVVDVGGRNVKVWRTDPVEQHKFPSGGEMTPRDMVRRTREIADWPWDVVALGLPCRVVAGRPAEEPENLGNGWVDFDYEAAYGRPVRIMNDANLQALGAYRGGRMLFVGLGTGVGTTLIDGRTIVSLDFGMLLHPAGEEVMARLSRDAQERFGLSRWQDAARDIVPRLRAAALADEVVLGGGQGEKIDSLPEKTRLGGNEDVVAGGVCLWQDLPDPAAAETAGGWRIL